MNVYFISGMCVNCKVFDKIVLPSGYTKKYIEWYIPHEGETLEAYTRKMALNIDTSEPFIIVGYSFGGIIMQEMNKFLTPHKNILISSIKNKDEIPLLFRLARKTALTEHLPKRLYMANKSISNLFTHLVYKMPIENIEECVTYTSPDYMKWSTHQITNWIPTETCKNIYHIHGTKDQVFPYKQTRNTITVEGGDHLMVMKMPEEINKILADIILKY